MSDCEEFHVFNPAFVRSVWRKRRKAEGRKPAPPRANYKGWTDDELAVVADGVRRNLTRQQIAHLVGRTKCSVTGIIHRNQSTLSPKPETPEL